jgi:hypothetical protein
MRQWLSLKSFRRTRRGLQGSMNWCLACASPAPVGGVSLDAIWSPGNWKDPARQIGSFAEASRRVRDTALMAVPAQSREPAPAIPNV